MTTNRVAAFLPADTDQPCAGCKYARRQLAIANATLDEAHRIERANEMWSENIADREREVAQMEQDDSRACLGAVVVFLAGVLLFVASLMVRFG